MTARGRRLAPAAVRALIQARAFAPGGPLTPGRVVNVLELNLALDRLAPRRPGPHVAEPRERG